MEAKFHLNHLGPIREKVLQLGGRLQVSRLLERNWRFDTSNKDLQQQHKLLRLRMDHRARLTFKHAPDRIEERWEIEIEVDDVQHARRLLEALGYQVTGVYEKYREIWNLIPAAIMLDELPFGCFVEIEAPSLKQVREAASWLDLPWEERVQSTYLQIFQRLKEDRHLDFEDVTFTNFQGLEPVGPRELKGILKIEGN